MGSMMVIAIGEYPFEKMERFCEYDKHEYRPIDSFYPRPYFSIRDSCTEFARMSYKNKDTGGFVWQCRKRDVDWEAMGDHIITGGITTDSSNFDRNKLYLERYPTYIMEKVVPLIIGYPVDTAADLYEEVFDRYVDEEDYPGLWRRIVDDADDDDLFTSFSCRI